ncbi:MAG: hypothetical protein JSU95_16225 [Betaproteobacteria bacterium]|nr:MAG: hypothetical protein JSU95_16225 [Betaproteobacteria bacterium]
MTATNRGRSKVVWSVLAVLLVIVATLEIRDWASRSDAEEATGPSMLMPAPMEEISAIEIAVDGNLHRFSRDENNAWFYHGIHAGPQEVHEHVPDPVMSEKIAKFLAGLGRARIERRFELTDDDPFGVTKPEMIILVYVSDPVKPTKRYSVGDLAPDDLSRYVHIAGGSEVVSIPDYQIQNLLNLIEAVTAQPPPAAASAS